jgi:hypothetical protein
MRLVLSKQWHLRLLPLIVALLILVFPMSGITAPPNKNDGTPTQNWDHTMAAGSRFVLLTDFGNTAVRDNETGLVWEQSPDPTPVLWTDALLICATKNVGNRKGWRVPSIPELASLVDPSVASPGPTLPAGHPFSNVQSSSAKGYWSATSMTANSALAWHVFFDNGAVTGNAKTVSDYVWCVRGPMNADAY